MLLSRDEVAETSQQIKEQQRREMQDYLQFLRNEKAAQAQQERELALMQQSEIDKVGERKKKKTKKKGARQTRPLAHYSTLWLFSPPFSPVPSV